MKMTEYTLEVADSLKEILGGVSEEAIEALIQILMHIKKENRKVYTVAAGRANLILRTFAMRLMQIGFRSYVVFDTNTPAMEAGDLLIAASGSGSTETVLAIAQQARSLGGHVVLFTKNPNSPLAEKGELTIEIPTSRCTKKLQTEGSEFEQSLFLLCDSIGVALMERMGCIQSIEEIDRFIRVLHANLQ